MIFEFEAIGTHWKIDIYETIGSSPHDTLLKSIQERIAIFDKNYSRFRNDSLVAEMSRTSGAYQLPDDAHIMMDLYEHLYHATDGLITPLVGQVISDAGYDAEYSLIEKEIHPAPKWNDVLEYNFPNLILKRPALLDFGSLGKGYLIDIVGDIILKSGVEKFCINAGGDILYHNPLHNHGEALRIGLENPNDFSQAIGVVSLPSGSLCGSSGSRRKWGRFHHIIDPYKLQSPTEIIATWTTHHKAIMADGLATALFFVPPQKLSDCKDFEYLVLHADMSIEKSENFPAEMFIGVSFT